MSEEQQSNLTDVLLAGGNKLMLEGIIILMALHEHDFYNKAGRLICDGEGAFVARDFSEVPQDNLLYAYVHAYWKTYGGVAVRPPHLQAFPVLANHLVDSGVWAESEVDTMKTRLSWLCLKPKTVYAPYLQRGPEIVCKWLEGVRLKKLIERAASGLITHKVLTEDMVKLRSKLSSLEEGQRTFLFGSGLDFVRPDVKRIPTPWAKVNNVVGGFGIGEADIVIAPRGAGKTVFATQCGAFAALAGYKTLFVTCEQPPHELEPRIVSQYANVPFEKIVDGLRGHLDRCTPMEQEKAHALIEQLKPNLEFHQWKRGESVALALPALIKDYQDRHGRLDFLVYDWIGKGLGVSSSTDSSALRMMYRVAATAVAETAQDFDIAVLTFAQANVVLSFNKKLVDDTMVTEHKQIAEDMTRGFGLSCLRAGNDENARIDDKQYLNIFKSRKAEGRAIILEREFGFQRFKEWEFRKKA